MTPDDALVADPNVQSENRSVLTGTGEREWLTPVHTQASDWCTGNLPVAAVTSAAATVTEGI